VRLLVPARRVLRGATIDRLVLHGNRIKDVGVMMQGNATTFFSTNTFANATLSARY
jgi:hypothetical protein